MDQDDTTTNTPRSSARRAERDARTIDSPERRRIPGPRLPAPIPLPQPFQLPAPAPVAGPSQFEDPFLNNYVAPPPRFQNLPVHLAQAYASLPPLRPTRGRGGAYPRQNQPQQPVNRRGRPRQDAENNNWVPMPAPEMVNLLLIKSIFNILF